MADTQRDSHLTYGLREEITNLLPKISKQSSLNPLQNIHEAPKSEKLVLEQKEPETKEPKQFVPINDSFVVPKDFQKDVDFWSKVYREWDIHQVVFYDSKSKVVYDVLDLPLVPKELSSAKYSKQVKSHRQEIEAILEKIKNRESFKPDNVLANKLKDVIKKNNLSLDVDLTTQLKQQSGLRTQFEDGLKISGRYIDDMKSVLRAYQLPEDLVAIVFVESLFTLSAVSHAGASGPWGIVKETGLRLGIQVNRFTDERIDPIFATWAAARYLRQAYEGLKSWPLAITSYNYGYAGMMRASKNLNTDDLAIIHELHDSPIYGYASKSYYPEFLAARDCLKNQDKYFPNAKKKEQRWQYELVQIKHPASAVDLIGYKVLSQENLSNFNPSLSKLTINGKEVIPADYSLRVPKGEAKKFYSLLKKVPDEKRKKAADMVSSTYKVRGKETIFSIAKKHGISADYLAEALKKPLNYQLKGSIKIRSQAHLYSQLSDVHKESGLAQIIKE